MTRVNAYLRQQYTVMARAIHSNGIFGLGRATTTTGKVKRRLWTGMIAGGVSYGV